MKKKHLSTVKDKALIKLEKDKLQRRAYELNEEIKEIESRAQKQLAKSKRAQNDSPKYS